jgi:hypothetical protein
LVVAVAALTYFGAGFVITTARETPRELRRLVLLGRARTAIPLAVVLASTGGLIALVLPLLGWATFALMFIPIAVSRYEFGRWGEARRTYGETVRTLALLAEGAGYIPPGHSARVANLCVKIGRELALPPSEIHELELVGLLHDVGAVSLPDPSDLSTSTTLEVAESTGELLAETEYLGAYADIVLDVARGKSDVPVPGRILRIADAFENAVGPIGRRVLQAEAAAQPGDEAVVAALKRVLAVA